jgi:tellurite resistance protein
MRAWVVQAWSQKVGQLRNRAFLDAAMAAAALVSGADAQVRLSEQLALDEVLGRIDKLQVFEPNTAVDLHRRFVEQLEADADKGRRSALDAVRDFHGDPNDRLLILYVGAVIARADHELSAPEEAVLGEICDALGLPAQESLRRIWGIVASEPASA